MGNCTSQVEFYNSTNDYNYKRTITWSIVMAYLSHTHPTFETVYTIEAINELLQDTNLTPGLGRCEFFIILSWINWNVSQSYQQSKRLLYWAFVHSSWCLESYVMTLWPLDSSWTLSCCPLSKPPFRLSAICLKNTELDLIINLRPTSSWALLEQSLLDI